MNEENTTPFALVLTFVLGIESIVAFLGNGFIIVVNGHRWLQSRKMLPSDLLLTALGTTRFLLQLVLVLFQLWLIFPSEFLCHNYIWEISFCAWAYFSLTSIMCATWLSVFYCVKVTNFAHCLFLWFKPRIDRLVPRLLGLSFTIFSLPLVVTGVKVKNYCILTANMTGNTSQGEDSSNHRFQIFSYLHFTFISINVSICLTASILLLISLWRHTRNLKKSGITTKDFSTRAHISVVNSLLSFLFFYLLYVVALTTSLNYTVRTGVAQELIFDISLSLCPSAHSVVLILTNPKLKDVCIQILKIRQRTSKNEEGSRHVSMVR